MRPGWRIRCIRAGRSDSVPSGCASCGPPWKSWRRMSLADAGAGDWVKRTTEPGHETGILKIVCPDRRGIVAAVSSFLSEHQANIIDAQQHTAQAEGAFFMRVEFELTGMDLSKSEI